jgi:lipoprotein-releasing system permease protein
MLSLRIAVRFLRKSPVQSILIILGVSVGISVQIFIGSLIASLQTYLIDTTLGSSPHLTITSTKTDGPIALDPELKTALGKISGVKWTLPECNVSAVVAKGSQTTPLAIRCGEPKTLDNVYKISPKITKGQYVLGNDNIIVGTVFADKYGLSPGSDISLTLPGQPAQQVTVSGVADFGSKQLNETLAFSDTKFGQAALGLNSDQYSMIVLQLNDVFQSTADAATITKTDKHAKVADWQVEQKDLLSGLQAQSSSTLMIQFFVMVAVALGIASTLSFSAIQKTRQIGILKALGLTDRRAGLVFLWQGILLGILGASGGLLLGVGLIAIFTATAGSRPGSFPITPQATFVAVSFAIGVAVAVVSALLPTRRTSRLDPIEVIQSGG